jgi:hypothetical protein
MTEREQEFFQLCERFIQHGEKMQERLDFWRGRYKHVAKRYMALKMRHEEMVAARAIENKAGEILLGAAMDELLARSDRPQDRP